jgi:hypothetical protein
MLSKVLKAIKLIIATLNNPFVAISHILTSHLLVLKMLNWVEIWRVPRPHHSLPEKMMPLLLEVIEKCGGYTHY